MGNYRHPLLVLFPGTERGREMKKYLKNYWLKISNFDESYTPTCPKTQSQDRNMKKMTPKHTVNYLNQVVKNQLEGEMYHYEQKTRNEKSSRPHLRMLHAVDAGTLAYTKKVNLEFPIQEKHLSTTRPHKVWWPLPVIPTLGRQRHENHQEVEASLGTA